MIEVKTTRAARGRITLGEDGGRERERERERKRDIYIEREKGLVGQDKREFCIPRTQNEEMI
jgi:hypothetical protein